MNKMVLGLLIAGGSVLAFSSANAQIGTVTRLMTKDLPDVAGKEGMMETVDFAPGEVSQPHRHNADVFVYVLKGSIVTQVKGGSLQTVQAGGVFYESPTDLHIVSRNASDTQPAKLLVFYVKAKGAPPSELLKEGESGEAAGDVARPQTSSPTDFVDTLNSTFGKQTRNRATHAKGVVALGKFTPGEAAQSVSKAPHFRQSVPVTCRFSNNTGIPTLPDADDHATPHGMALKFRLPDGSETDLVTHSFNGFPAATGDEMRQFFIAIGSSGAGVASPTPLDKFLAAHPAAQKFATTQEPPPVSYGTLAYFGVNSFEFTNADGKVMFGRYQIIPKAGKRFLSKEEISKAAPDYLTSELRDRLAKAPVRFDVRLQLPESGDKIDDPSIAWSDKNKTVDLGVIEITSVVPDSDTTQRNLLFLPGVLPVGIEPADPMIPFRDKAYPISYDRRHAGETEK